MNKQMNISSKYCRQNVDPVPSGPPFWTPFWIPFWTPFWTPLFLKIKKE